MSDIVDRAQEVVTNEYEDPWYRPYPEVVMRLAILADQFDESVAMCDRGNAIDRAVGHCLAISAKNIRDTIDSRELKFPDE